MQMVQNDDGSLGPVTAGSTQPVAMVVHHAGIVRVKRYNVGMPWGKAEVGLLGREVR